MPLEKYTYWVETSTAGDLRSRLEHEGLDVFVVRKAVCIPLSTRYEVGLIPPEAWRDYEFCRRQFSWQRSSRFYGMTLIISGVDLAAHGLTPETIIRAKPEFKPPPLPGPECFPALVQTRAYLDSKPAEWDDLSREDPDKIKNWQKIMGLAQEPFSRLLLSHSANHANFLSPTFFMTEDNGLKVPYSIAPTAGVCSACLEFFNIIGPSLVKKLVVPCPGAALFAGLASNTYYEVFSPRAVSEPGTDRSRRR
ncbi:MAG: hypothetical protein V1816_02250 [Pseudomonadota bacterium]